MQCVLTCHCIVDLHRLFFSDESGYHTHVRCSVVALGEQAPGQSRRQSVVSVCRPSRSCYKAGAISEASANSLEVACLRVVQRELRSWLFLQSRLVQALLITCRRLA